MARIQAHVEPSEVEKQERLAVIERGRRQREQAELTLEDIDAKLDIIIEMLKAAK